MRRIQRGRYMTREKERKRMMYKRREIERRRKREEGTEY